MQIDERIVLLLCGLMVVASAAGATDSHPGHPKNGKSLYQQHCLRCHGVKLDGDGPDSKKLSTRPPDFHKYLSRVKGDLELEVTIRQGRKLTAMHEWDNLLSDQQIYDLIAYIRSAVPHREVMP
jgi:mono/diheme cytochrome c family protein